MPVLDSLQFKNAPHEAAMLYKLGRALQVAGMIITPIGVAGNIYNKDQFPITYSLTVAAIGAVVFYAGWRIQQFGRPR
jgi:hypothetical protein